MLARAASDSRLGKGSIYASAVGGDVDTMSEASRVHVSPKFIVPSRPKLRPVDHWDLIVAFDAEKYRQEQCGDGGTVDKQKREKFRGWLDGQMADQHEARGREAGARNRECEEMAAQVAENKRHWQAEADVESGKKEQVRKACDEMGQRLEKRKAKLQHKKEKEADELAAWLAADRAQAEKAEAEERIKHATKCRAALEGLAVARREKADLREKENQAEIAMNEESIRVSNEREAKARAEVKAREDRLEMIAATLGEQVANGDAEKEREIEERVARVQAESAKLASENARNKQATFDRKNREMVLNLDEQVKEFKSRGKAEKEADAAQAKLWKKQHADGEEVERIRVLKAKQARASLDTQLVNQMQETLDVHPMQFGMTAQAQQRELAMNRRLFDQMAAEGFYGDASAMMAGRASDKGRLVPCGSVAKYDGPIHPLELKVSSGA